MFKSLFERLEKRITRISAGNLKAAPFAWQIPLIAFSMAYKALVMLRNSGFRAGIRKINQLSCPVISVGNIVAGGTGKTPMTLYLVRLMLASGLRPVILSRGYKAMFEGEYAIVSDGKTLFSDPGTAGDEPFMMAALKLCPVVIGKDRYRAGVKAVNEFAPDVIILDDGFQHRKLHRDLNLLLLDYKNPLGNGWLLPAGRLREPVPSALKRADALIFTRADKPAADKTDKHHFPDIPSFKCAHKPYIVSYIKGQESSGEAVTGFQAIKGKRVFLVSALADNHAFYRSMQQAGLNIVGHLEFKDHYRYKKADIQVLNRMAKKKETQIILTTHKDWVKMAGLEGLKIDIGVVDIEIVFERAAAFQSFIKENTGIS